MKRVFLIVLDGFGIGELPDADEFGDRGSNTLAGICNSPHFSVPNLKSLGLFHIEGVHLGEEIDKPQGAYGRLAERSAGKDTTVGHWEIAGLISEQPMPTFPDGFPEELIDNFTKITGCGVICNKPYSGTKVLEDYGDEHMKTGKLILYTSADSVFQIAAHEDVIPVETLYHYCELAREMLIGKYAVGRVIARPFTGKYPNYIRTDRRHDYSLLPPKKTMLDILKANKADVIGVGKIYDIFAGKGITATYKTSGNQDGMLRTDRIAETDFSGLCFVNLVDFDMLFGHRNDIDGFAKALSEFDDWLGDFLKKMREDDILFITGDHGCDPSTASTDHSREYTPLLIAGSAVKQGADLRTRDTFADISATILDLLNCSEKAMGTSFKSKIIMNEKGDCYEHTT